MGEAIVETEVGESLGDRLFSDVWEDGAFDDGAVRGVLGKRGVGEDLVEVKQ